MDMGSLLPFLMSRSSCQTSKLITLWDLTLHISVNSCVNISSIQLGVERHPFKVFNILSCLNKSRFFVFKCVWNTGGWPELSNRMCKSYFLLICCLCWSSSWYIDSFSCMPWKERHMLLKSCMSWTWALHLLLKYLYSFAKTFLGGEGQM